MTSYCLSMLSRRHFSSVYLTSHGNLAAKKCFAVASGVTGIPMSGQKWEVIDDLEMKKKRRRKNWTSMPIGSDENANFCYNLSCKHCKQPVEGLSDIKKLLIRFIICYTFNLNDLISTQFTHDKIIKLIRAFGSN